MAGDLQQTVGRLKAKMLVLADRFRLVCKERDDARERIADLEKQLDKHRKQCDELQQQVDFLKIATTIAPQRSEVEQTRSLLTDLIRDIDKCIADLKE